MYQTPIRYCAANRTTRFHTTTSAQDDTRTSTICQLKSRKKIQYLSPISTCGIPALLCHQPLRSTKPTGTSMEAQTCVSGQPFAGDDFGWKSEPSSSSGRLWLGRVPAGRVHKKVADDRGGIGRFVADAVQAAVTGDAAVQIIRRVDHDPSTGGLQAKQ